MSQANPPVCIVDDDELVRDVLKDIFETEGQTVGAFSSSAAFLDHLASGAHPSCVLCDVRMPEMDGLALLREVSARNLGIPFIMVTGYGEVDLAVEAMKIGAVDFIEKPFNAEQIIAAVNYVLKRPGSTHTRERLAALTPREREIAALLAKGGTNKSIARDAGCSPRTVEVHRARIMEKMNAKSLAELVRELISTR
jgi:two-component system response regulator FixJ